MLTRILSSRGGFILVAWIGFELARSGVAQPQPALPGPAGLATNKGVELHDIGMAQRLPQEEARRGVALRLNGVVTCVLPELHAFVMQDATGGIYVLDRSKTNALPALAERVEVEGVSEPGIAILGRVRSFGAGTLPEPERPTWNQLMNASLDCRWVEIQGVNESILNRSNGWSRLSLRTENGVLRVELRRAGLSPVTLDQCRNAVIRLRGCLFAAADAATGRVKAGQVRMHDAEIFVDEPVPADLFSISRKTAAELMRHDADMAVFTRVKVAGQVVFVRGNDCFVTDGSDGLRLLSESSLGLAVGDLVEAVGFPEWGYASPCLRGVVARKTGHADLPAPRELKPEELAKVSHDATIVEVQGRLASIRQNGMDWVLEMQSGSWRFLARIQTTNSFMQSLRLGSQLDLTGVYCAQGGYVSLGNDVVPIDLLIDSPAGIKVLSTPPWWNLERVLVVVGILACLLVAMVLWVTLLRRQVEARTCELQTQIQNRERAEHQRSLEQERARIARDLHDELGADITEVGMLAMRSKSAVVSDEERNHCLDQMAGKTGQMVSALEEIVWAMNPQNDSLASLVSYFAFYADRFLALASIKLHIEQSAGSVNPAVDTRLRHQMFLVFKEALANIVNHAGATEVRVKFQTEAPGLRLIIADNGRGLSGQVLADGRDGLSNMRSRVERIGGRFEIATESGRGTTLNVFVPLS